MALLFSDKIPLSIRNAFVIEVQKIADDLGFYNADWLMLVFRAESNVTPQAVNPNSNATGLIQFLPSTARDLGTTVENLKKLNALQQLPYVREYLRRAIKIKSVPKSAYDLYFLVHYPKAFQKSNETVLYSSDTTAYKNNPLDYNKNGDVTVAEVKAFLNKFVPVGYDYLLLESAKKQDSIIENVPNYVLIIILSLLFGSAVFLGWFKLLFTAIKIFLKSIFTRK